MAAHPPRCSCALSSASPAADGLLFARVSYEFLRPVPLAAIEVRAEIVRPEAVGAA